MGGTFDPIHHGHLVAASEVQAWFDLDEVVFVPTGDPWQKSDRDVTEAEHRYLMTVVATAANPRFNVSRVDIDRDGPTYTIDTLRDLKAEMPDAELFFITGADALADIFTWRDADELFELATFVGCTRPGYEMDPATIEKIPSDKVTMVEIPALAISSTDCRDRIVAASPSGTSCPTASSSTSPSTTSTPLPTRPRTTARTLHDSHRPRPRARRRRGPGRARQEGRPGPGLRRQRADRDHRRLRAGQCHQRACVGAIVDEVEDKLRDAGAKPIRREGHREGRWVLLDYGEIVIHVQHEEERMFYALERLWSDCPVIPLTLT